MNHRKGNKTMATQYVIDDRETGETLFQSESYDKAIAFALQRANELTHGMFTENYMQADDGDVEFFIREFFYIDTMFSMAVQ